MSDDLLLLLVALDESNEELADYIRKMAAARDAGCKHILCFIGGLDQDKRELPDIPEVRAFCKRLIDQGFISFLDFTGGLKDIADLPPSMLGKGLGAAEIMLIADGLMKDQLRLSMDDVRTLAYRWVETNEIANRALKQ